jgi:hypothetical protein
MRPGVDVISRALPPPRSAPTNTGVAFIIGATLLTTTQVALVHSLSEYVAVFGDRGTGTEQPTYDALDVYFREGGSQAYVASTSAAGLMAAKASKSKSTSDDAEVSAAAVDTGIAAALAALSKDLGPGQVLIADSTLAATIDNQSALLAHALATNRVALLSTADADVTTMTAAGTALQSDPNARYGALFAPSANVPGVTAGTTRTVPYSAIEAGIIARNDLAYSPNQASAGVLGQSQYALGVNTPAGIADCDYTDLNEAGVNMARVIYGGVRTYGYRSCANPTSAPEWLDFGWARLNMGIVAQSEAIGENYVFSQIDGRGRTIASFGGDLSAMLAVFYNEGSLYGQTPEEAYDVDVGVAVNTDATIANGELHAILSVRMSAMAEWVEIEIVKYATDQALPVAA